MKCVIPEASENIDGFVKCGFMGQREINGVLLNGVFCDAYCGWFKRTKRKSYVFCHSESGRWNTNHLRNLDCLDYQIEISESRDIIEYFSFEFRNEILTNNVERIYKRYL